MKMRKIALATALVTGLPLAQADVRLQPTTTLNTQNLSQIPSDESLKKLVDIQHMEKNLAEMINQNKEVIAKSIDSSLNHLLPQQELNATQRQQLLEALNELTQHSMDDLNQPQIRQQMINAYIATAKKTYSQDEVNAMITFYGSAVGQSVITKQVQLNKSYAEQIMPFILENQQKSMTKYLPTFEKKVQSIVNTNARNTKIVNKKNGKK